LEQENIELKNKVKELEEEKNKKIHKDFQDSQKQIGLTFSTLLGSPSIESLNPATAIML
jgi:hypothetical protein